MRGVKYLVSAVLILAGLLSAKAQKIVLSADYELTKVCGNQKLTGNGITVVVFYAPQCPVCLAQTQTISNLKDSFSSKGVDIIMVYPGTFYSKSFLRKFHRKYHLSVTAYIDKSKRLTDALGATSTPQAFVVDSSGQIAYSGKIDNLYETVGKRRQVITERYLFNAIQQVLQGSPVTVPKTEPVGCLIN